EKQVGLPNAIDNFVTISSTLGQPEDENMTKWRQRLKDLFPYENLSSFNLNGIGSGLFTVDALRRAGQTPTRESFLAAVGQTRGFETGGIYAGPLNCEAGKNHQCNQGMAWIQKQQGKLRIISVIKLD